MAEKVEVVITIPKNYLKHPQDYACLAECVRRGVPLPKGHGDLVDFDGLCKEYWDGNYMEIHKDDLSNIKPIIEADGGEEDEVSD